MREQLLELRPRVLRGDDHDLDVAQAPDEAIERPCDLLEVLADELLDVALVPSLRPATLVVLPGLLLRVVGEILQPATAQAVEVPALAADDDHEGALAATDERDEVGQVERPPHLDVVRDRFRERQRAPDVVESGREDREPRARHRDRTRSHRSRGCARNPS
jgi:hypothetical protein